MFSSGQLKTKVLPFSRMDPQSDAKSVVHLNLLSLVTSRLELPALHNIWKVFVALREPWRICIGNLQNTYFEGVRPNFCDHMILAICTFALRAWAISGMHLLIKIIKKYVHSLLSVSYSENPPVPYSSTTFIQPFAWLAKLTPGVCNKCMLQHFLICFLPCSHYRQPDLNYFDRFRSGDHQPYEHRSDFHFPRHSNLHPAHLPCHDLYARRLGCLFFPARLVSFCLL